MERPTSSRIPLIIVAVAAGCVSLFALQRWLAYDAVPDLQVSLPGGDGRPESAGTGTEATDLSGTFEALSGTPADLPGSWPRFRGEDFDNICKADVALADSWEDGGPEVLWSVELGEGHAAPTVLDGRVYVLDYDEETRADALRCFSLENGEEIWRRSYAVSLKRNHGMSRTIPAVTEDYVVTLGPRCHVVCVDAKTGDFRWGISLQDTLGTTEPLWYAGQCPMIDEGRAILAPGGPEALLVAVDCETGERVWETPNPNGWIMSHSSIMPMEFGGKRMYVYCAIGGIVGVSAEEGDAGTIVWEVPWDANVVAPSPVPLDDGRVFMTAGYGNGCLMLQIQENGGTFSAEVLFDQSPKEWLACEQQTPIYHDGLLYGIMPKDAGGLRGQFVCYRPDDSLVWSSGPANRFGLGPFVLADGKFYVLSDDGVLTMLQVSGEEYVQLDQAKVLDGHDAWGPIAVVGERMLMRDSKTMVCIDVGPKG